MEINNVLDQVQPETKEVYEAPVMEIVEVNVEQGFQSSRQSSPRDRDTW